MVVVSHEHEYIFIHNYKVAGSSIKRALRDDRSPWRKAYVHLRNRLGDVVGDDYWQTFHSHATAREVRDALPDGLWEEYYTFGFVRNPWSWQVSLYFYMLQTPEHYQHDLVSEMDGFEEYIHWRVTEDKTLQQEFFVDESGELLVDHVGRLENIQEEFQTICEVIGLDGVSLPHKNESSHDHYTEYYTEETRELVAEHFAPDIERFDYSY
jgi:hypothetical protein